MTMIRKTALLVAAVMALNCAVPAFASVVAEKRGMLKTDEIWEGQVKVTGDVIVPKGMTLTVKNGTVITYDKKPDGSVPDLMVFGTLRMDDREFTGKNFQSLPVDNKTKVIQIVPYEVDTKILRDEFASFKFQYALIWVILGGALIYAVSHR